MSDKKFTTTDRVYYDPKNGASPVFVADKGVEISMELAERLGLIKKDDTKRIAVTDVENKKRPAPANKKPETSGKE